MRVKVRVLESTRTHVRAHLMAKYLYILRHAKSSWDFPDLNDFDRPLNKRGKRNLSLVSERLAQQAILPEEIIASPAKRTRKTAEAVRSRLGLATEKLRLVNGLYEAEMTDFLTIIRATSPHIGTLMLVGHNPGLTTLVNALGDKYLRKLPTCAWVLMELDIASWTEMKQACGHWLVYERPKQFKHRQ